LHERLPAALGKKEAGVNLLKTSVDREFIGSRTYEKDMR